MSRGIRLEAVHVGAVLGGLYFDLAVFHAMTRFQFLEHSYMITFEQMLQHLRFITLLVSLMSCKRAEIFSNQIERSFSHVLWVKMIMLLLFQSLIKVTHHRLTKATKRCRGRGC